MIKYRIIHLCLVTILTMGWISACNYGTSKVATSPVSVKAISSCRAIYHAMGETCVPIHPKRIIALSGSAVDAMLSLDIKPVAAVTNVADLWKDKLQSVESLGDGDQVNLEKVLSLKPDLILGSKWSIETIYDRLTRIAPTVIDDVQSDGEWKSLFMLHAKALGMTSRANELMNEYNQRLQELRLAIGERAKQTQVSLVRVYPDRIGLYLKDCFPGNILSEVGFARPPAQNKLGYQAVISKERIRDADGDVIFMWSFGANELIAKTAKTALENIKTDLLWQDLDAVQQGRVYQVGNYWHVASSPVQAKLIIDDLFKYLVNE